MAKFNFNEFIGSASVENISLACKTKHTHVVVVFNAYDVDLYKSWSLELANFLKKIPSIKIYMLDVGHHLLHLQRSFIRQVWVGLVKFLHKHDFWRHRYLIKYDFKCNTLNKASLFLKSFRDTVHYLRCNSFNFQNNNDFKSKSIFSTLATDFGTVEFKVRRHAIKVLFLSLAYDLSYSKTDAVINKLSPCMIFVGNGRLVKSAAIVAAARAREVHVQIIERGAFPGTYDIYSKSPHSIQERRQQAVALHNKFGALEAARISRRYVELRQTYDPISGVQWNQGFKPGKLPLLDERKICVCFTSTETEFAVFGDRIPSEYFQNQEQAFRTLASVLDPDKWQVLIRRHPYGNKKYKNDPEGKLWLEINKMNHVKIIGPYDAIDSYELVKSCDLVAHFNSSMGPEAVSLQTAPVITLGPTIWEDENSLYYVNSERKLLNFFTSSHSIREKSDINIWGLYWATFGYKFQLIDWRENQAYLHGKRVL